MVPVSATRSSAKRSNFSSEKAHFGAAVPLQSKEDLLVTNLKQQIGCLEMEVQYLRQQAAAMPQSTTSTRLNQTTASSVAEKSSDANLLRRAEELENEVQQLRIKYATREQAHALEVAELRQQLDLFQKKHYSSSSIRDEVEKREHQVKGEIHSLKQLHAQEVVALQRTMDRLNAELQNRQSLIDQLNESREGLSRDLVYARDAARTAESHASLLKKQHDETMVNLNSEQAARRAAESKLDDLKSELSVLRGETLPKNQQKVEALEAANKSFQTANQMIGYELEQARLVQRRQQDDLSKSTGDLVDLTSKCNVLNEQIKEFEVKLGRATTGLADLQAEKEYYRLQADRLKVENTALETKASGFEQALNAERAAIVALERQHCAALDQLEQLRREAKTKEDVYRAIDNHNAELRLEHRYIREERDDLQRRMDQLNLQHTEANKQLESLKHLANAQRTEEQLQNALVQLSKTKAEMQELLSAQARIATSFATAVIDIPDSIQVSKALSPARAQREEASQMTESLDVTVRPYGNVVSNSSQHQMPTMALCDFGDAFAQFMAKPLKDSRETVAVPQGDPSSSTDLAAEMAAVEERIRREEQLLAPLLERTE
jgi:chromosome segregation ATPase